MVDRSMLPQSVGSAELDRNGGLGGTLASPRGAITLEPWVVGKPDGAKKLVTIRPTSEVVNPGVGEFGLKFVCRK